MRHMPDGRRPTSCALILRLSGKLFAPEPSPLTPFLGFLNSSLQRQIKHFRCALTTQQQARGAESPATFCFASSDPQGEVPNNWKRTPFGGKSEPTAP